MDDMQILSRNNRVTGKWAPLLLLTLGLSLGLGILTTVHAARAEQESDSVLYPFLVNDIPELHKYVANKYGSNANLMINAQKDILGAKIKSLSIFGDLTQGEIVTPKEGKHGLARAAAEAVLAREAGPLLGVTDLANLRVVRIKPKPPMGNLEGYMTIRYQRYVEGFPIYRAFVNIVVNTKGHVRSFHAQVTPVSPAMRQALKRKKAMLSKKAIRKLVKADLKAALLSSETPGEALIGLRRVDPRRLELHQYAVGSPPYLIWEVETVWQYFIDGFSGKILRKSPGWRS